MKKLLTLNLLIAVLFLVSCKKDNPIDDYGDVPCPCADTIYYTKYLIKDTVLTPDAEYFYPVGYSTDSFLEVNPKFTALCSEPFVISEEW